MTYTVIATNRFKRQAQKFRRQHPDLSKRFAAILRDLAQDPYQPHLHMHPLHGPLDGFHAIRLAHSFRITLTILISEREITLHDIGSHDEVYRG